MGPGAWLLSVSERELLQRPCSGGAKSLLAALGTKSPDEPWLTDLYPDGPFADDQSTDDLSTDDQSTDDLDDRVSDIPAEGARRPARRLSPLDVLAVYAATSKRPMNEASDPILTMRP